MIAKIQKFHEFRIKFKMFLTKNDNILVETITNLIHLHIKSMR